MCRESALAPVGWLTSDEGVPYGATDDEAAILAIERPDPKLWTYYVLCSLVILPLAPIFLLVSWFRYSTLRYRFTSEGVSMSWGILFRREVLLNYARIQDIHLQSNVVERWLGLARIQIQTASGSAAAEMTVEGVTQFEAVRDFLYSRMRGVGMAKAQEKGRTGLVAGATLGDNQTSAELAQVLREIAGELREIRAHLNRPKGPSGDSQSRETMGPEPR